LHLAGEIARSLHAELVIVHAVGLTEMVDGEHVIAEQHRREIADQFAGWCETVRSIGLETWTPRLHHGAPVDTLLRVAAEIDPAVIVVGRQGAGKRPELLLGSTAHQIAENSRSPVLIVPPVGRASRPGV
jgi:nucleotide-binding universal stress UspA family protein